MKQIAVAATLVILLFARNSSAQFPILTIQRSLLAHVRSGIVMQDITLIGEVSRNGEVQPMRMMIRGNAQIRSEAGSGNNLQTLIFDNGNGWVGNGSSFRPVESHAAQRPSIVPFLDLMSEVQNPRIAASDGNTYITGGDAEVRVRLELPDATPEKRFKNRPLNEAVDIDIDPSTFLVRRLTRLIRSTTNQDFQVPVVTEYSDYRDVQGVKIPFRVITKTGTAELGVHVSTIVWHTVYINSDLSESIFRPQ